MSDDFLWVEKYRPKTIDNTILPDRLKTIFKAIVAKGELPNMLFSGTAGVGKTTVAKALCNEMGLDYIVINGSDERNIDTLRNKVKQFASTISLGGGSYKVVILDEADYLNPLSFQPALRAFIEEFSNNCRFILTCNYKNRIIPPLHSRCSVYEFTPTRADLPQLSTQFMKKAESILQNEGVEYNAKTIVNLILKHSPDWRRILNELQRSALTGSVSDETMVNTPTKFKELFEYLKAKDFKKMRKWVVNNMDVESTAIFRGIYDEMGEYVTNSYIPQLILTLADYQYKAAFVADQEINIVACMTEIMADGEFK